MSIWQKTVRNDPRTYALLKILSDVSQTIFAATPKGLFFKFSHACIMICQKTDTNGPDTFEILYHWSMASLPRGISTLVHLPWAKLPWSMWIDSQERIFIVYRFLGDLLKVDILQKQDPTDNKTYQVLHSFRMPHYDRLLSMDKDDRLFWRDTNNKIHIFEKFDPQDIQSYGLIQMLHCDECIITCCMNSAGTLFTVSKEGRLLLWHKSTPDDPTTYEPIDYESIEFEDENIVSS